MKRCFLFEATVKKTVALSSSVNGDGLNADRLHRFAIERFRVSVAVSYT
jgi:hypothetical protein